MFHGHSDNYTLDRHKMYQKLRDLGHMGGLQDVLTFGLDINLTLSYRKSPSAWGFFCVSKEITGKNCSFVFALRK